MVFLDVVYIWLGFMHLGGAYVWRGAGASGGVTLPSEAHTVREDTNWAAQLKICCILIGGRQLGEE